MKEKFYILSFIIIFLITFIGIPQFVHFCQITERSYLYDACDECNHKNNALSCCDEESDSSALSCCDEKSDSSEIIIVNSDEEDCCLNQIVLLKIDDEFILTQTDHTLKNSTHLIAFIPKIFQSDISFFSQYIVKQDLSPPSKITSNKFIINHSLLI